MTKRRVEFELSGTDKASRVFNGVERAVKRQHDTMQRELIETTRLQDKARFSAAAYARSLKVNKLSHAGAMLSSAAGHVGLGGLGSAALVAGAVGAVRQSFNDLDELAKRADKLAVFPEEFQKLEYAAKLSGVEVNLLEKSLQTYVKRAGEASRGNATAAAVFKRLGVDAGELKRLDLPSEMKLLADAFARIGDGKERLNLAVDLFGMEGADMLNLLKGGGAALQNLYRERERLGGLMTRADLAEVEAANDAWTEMQTAVKVSADVLAVEFAPAVKSLAEAAADAARHLGKWARSAGGREPLGRESLDDRRQDIRKDLLRSHRDWNPFSAITNLGRAGAWFVDKETMKGFNEEAASTIKTTDPAKLQRWKELAQWSDEQDRIAEIQQRAAPKLRAVAPIGWLQPVDAREFNAAKALNDPAIAKQREQAASILTDTFHDFRRAIPLATREAAADAFNRAVTDPGSLLGILPKLGADAVGAVRVPDFIRARDESPAERYQRTALPDSLTAVVSRTLRGGTGRVDPAERQVKTLEENVKVGREFVREIRGVRRAVEDIRDKDAPAAGPTGF